MHRIILFVVAALLLMSPATATEWAKYTNARFGFSIDLPQNVFEDANRSDNGDGLGVSGLDGRANLLVYGFNNVLDQSPQDLAHEADNDLTAVEVTYRRVTKGWAVISGFADMGDDRIVFYTRYQANKNLTRYSAFRLTYPVSVRGLFDPLVGRLSKSLTAPR
ncbi:MAG: hypothetical protein AAFO61_07160 [Pseudomonadota bacterium]